MVRIETFPEKIIHSFYEAFRKIAPVRVLMKVAKADEMPLGLPSNVLTQPWFSQVKILSEFGIIRQTSEMLRPINYFYGFFFFGQINF